MASYIGQIKIGTGGTAVPVGSMLYGICAETIAANTTQKDVTLDAFDTLATGVTVHVKFVNANTATAPTLKVGSTDAKTITNPNGELTWSANSVISFTYDGTNWVMNSTQPTIPTGASYSDTAVTGEFVSEVNQSNGQISVSRVALDPSISITAGTSSTAPKINVTVNTKSGTAQTLTTAATNKYGVTKLSSATDSTSTSLAATPSAVKAAYDLANGKQDPITFNTAYDASTNKAATMSDITDAAYSNGTGITIDSNRAINHSNSVTAQSTSGVYPIKIDAQGHITEYGSKVTIGAAAAKGVDTSSSSITSSSTDSNLPTSKLVYNYVTGAISSAFATNDAMQFKGLIAGGDTGDYGALTLAANAGDTYKVSAAGKINGITVEIGDMLICTTDTTPEATSSTYSTVADNWVIVQTNIDGAVTGPTSSTEDHIATFSNNSGKVIKDSGYTIATSVPSDAVFTDTKVTTAALTSGTTYYPILATGTGTATRQIDSTLQGFKYTSTKGTTSAVGSALLQLGNATSSGTNNNEQGVIRLYSTKATYVDIKITEPSSSYTFYLPASLGTSNQVLTSAGASAALAWKTLGVSVTANNSGSVVTEVGALSGGTLPSFTQGTKASASIANGTLTLVNQGSDSFTQGSFPTQGTISKANLSVSLS